jgi:heme exporter protein A
MTQIQQVIARETSEPSVELRGLSKIIDGRIVLRNVNASVRAGELVGLVGANGAGKSTLLKIIATLSSPTSGELKLFGQSAFKASVELRKRIGLIDHQSLLYRDLTALENLEFYGGLYNLTDPRNEALKLLQRFSLDERADDLVKAFSRGMVQRVAIARALLHDPELLLADEPFAGLDAPSAEFLEKLFGQLTADGKAIILVSHDLEQTLRLADRVIVLRGGTVALDQPTHRLYLEEVLAEAKAP